MSDESENSKEKVRDDSVAGPSQLRLDLSEFLSFDSEEEPTSNPVVCEFDENMVPIAPESNTSQSTIPTAPLKGKNASNKGKGIKSKKDKVISTIRGGLIPKPDTVYLKSLSAHPLSAELQQYYVRLTEGLFGHNEHTRSDCMRTLERDYNIREILPYLAIFVKETIEQNIVLTDLSLLIYAVKVVKQLINNQYIQIKTELHTLLPAIISCVVSKKLCRTYIENHWTLRDLASLVIAEICKKYDCNLSNITQRVCEIYSRPLAEPNKHPLTTVYGAVKGLAALGPEQIKTYLFPNIKNVSPIIMTAEQSYGKHNDEIYKQLLKDSKHVRDAITNAVAPVLLKEKCIEYTLPVYEEHFGYISKYIHTEIRNLEILEERRRKTDSLKTETPPVHTPLKKAVFNPKPVVVEEEEEEYEPQEGVDYLVAPDPPKSNTGQDVQISYTPTQDVQISYMPTQDVQISYMPTEDVQVSYPPTQDVQVSYMPTQDVQVSYTPTQDVQVSYTPTPTQVTTTISTVNTAPCISIPNVSTCEPNVHESPTIALLSRANPGLVFSLQPAGTPFQFEGRTVQLVRNVQRHQLPRYTIHYPTPGSAVPHNVVRFQVAGSPATMLTASGSRYRHAVGLPRSPFQCRGIPIPSSVQMYRRPIQYSDLTIPYVPTRPAQVSGVSVQYPGSALQFHEQYSSSSVRFTGSPVYPTPPPVHLAPPPVHPASSPVPSPGPSIPFLKGTSLQLPVRYTFDPYVERSELIAQPMDLSIGTDESTRPSNTQSSSIRYNPPLYEPPVYRIGTHRYSQMVPNPHLVARNVSQQSAMDIAQGRISESQTTPTYSTQHPNSTSPGNFPQDFLNRDFTPNTGYITRPTSTPSATVTSGAYQRAASTSQIYNPLIPEEYNLPTTRVLRTITKPITLPPTPQPRFVEPIAAYSGKLNLETMDSMVTGHPTQREINNLDPMISGHNRARSVCNELNRRRHRHRRERPYEQSQPSLLESDPNDFEFSSSLDSTLDFSLPTIDVNDSPFSFDDENIENLDPNQTNK